MLTELPANDITRNSLTRCLATLLCRLGLSVNPKADLAELRDFPAHLLMERRIPVLMRKLGMAPTVEVADNFVRTR